MPTVLQIAHTFPPGGGSGAHRALAFARYLPDSGWNPVVLTPGEAWAAARDDLLAGRIPAGLPIVRTRSFEPRPGPPPPAALAATASMPHGRTVSRLKSQAAHALQLPDRHVGWTPFAVAAGLRAVREFGASALYSTAAPFTSHLVGLLLARTTGLPWVLELRDGWYGWNSTIFADYPRWRHPLERGLEGACVRRAARVVLVTERMAEVFRAQYADLPPGHFTVIPNGFDPEAFADVRAARHADGAFEIVHAGSLYSGRSVATFLRALAAVAARLPDLAGSLRLRLLGSLDSGARAEIAAAVQGGAIEARVQYEGQVDHRAALAALRGADLLLLIANTTAGAEATVPAKLFEYLAAGRPVLAVVPRGAEAEEVVRSTKAGWLADAADRASIERAIEAAVAAWRAGEPFQPNHAVVDTYDRSKQAVTLARVLDEACAAR